jgi:hypothetical protein
MESMAAPFMAAILEHLGVTNQDEPVQLPLKPSSSWLPAVMEAVKEQVGATLPDASPSSPSARQPGPNSRERDQASWSQLLADAFVEIAGEEVKAEPRVLGWRRPGYTRLPQVAEGRVARPQQTWKTVMARLGEVTRVGTKTDGFGDAVPISGSLDSDLHGLVIDEGIDKLLEDEICADEASWLDIGSDVVTVKNQVVQMIFSDLVEETVVEMGKLWTS